MTNQKKKGVSNDDEMMLRKAQSRIDAARAILEGAQSLPASLRLTDLGRAVMQLRYAESFLNLSERA